MWSVVKLKVEVGRVRKVEYLRKRGGGGGGRRDPEKNKESAVDKKKRKCSEVEKRE